MKKQYFIALGALSTIAPLAAVVSCNSKTSSTSETKSNDAHEVAALLRSKVTHAQDKMPSEIKATSESVLALLQEETINLKNAHLENIELTNVNDETGSLTLSLEVVDGQTKEALKWDFNNLQTKIQRQDADDLAVIKSLPRVFHTPGSAYTGSFMNLPYSGGGNYIGFNIGKESEGHPALTLGNWQAELQVGDLNKTWAPYHMDESNVTKVEFILKDENFDLTDKGFSELKYDISTFGYDPITDISNSSTKDTIFFYLTVTKGNVSQRLHVCVTGIDSRGISSRGK